MSATQLGYSNFVRYKCNVDLIKIKRNIIPILLYDRLASKYLSKKVSWDQSTIIIADTARIHQPYLAQNVVGLGKIAESRRVESIVKNFNDEFSSITLYKEQLSPNLKQQGTAMPTTRYMLYTLQNALLLDHELVNRTQKDNDKITPNDNDAASSVPLRTLPSSSSVVGRAKSFRADLIKQVYSPDSPKPNAKYKEVVKKIDNSAPMSYQPRPQKLSANASTAGTTLPVQSVKSREPTPKLVPLKAKTDLKPISTTSKTTNAREPTPKLVPPKAKTDLNPISTTSRATNARQPTPKLVPRISKTDLKPISTTSRATNAREPTPKLVPPKAKTDLKPISTTSRATNAREPTPKLVPPKAKTDLKPISTTSRATNAREPTPKLVPPKAKTDLKPISTTSRATDACVPTPKLVPPKAKTDLKPISTTSRATNAREPTPKLVPPKAKTDLKPISTTSRATNAREPTPKLVPPKAKTDLKPISTTSRATNAREPTPKLVPPKAKTDLKPISTTSRATDACEPTPKLVPPKAKPDLKPISTASRATSAREPTPKLVPPKPKTDLKPISTTSGATSAREPTPKLVPRKAKADLKPITDVSEATNQSVTKHQKTATARTIETKREPELTQTRRNAAATNKTAVLNRKPQSKAIDTNTKTLSELTNKPPKLIRSRTFTIEESAQPAGYPESPVLLNVGAMPIIEKPLVEVNVNLNEQIYKQKPTEQLSVLPNKLLLKLPLVQKTRFEDFVGLEEWINDEKTKANEANRQLTAEGKLNNQEKQATSDFSAL